MSGASEGRVAEVRFAKTRPNEASNFVCFDSAHPTYLERICVRTIVARIFIVPALSEREERLRVKK